MELYFLRHGDAEMALFKTPRADFDRNLTEQGAEDILKCALAMKIFVEGFDVIFTSPYTRAVQTATIFGRVFKCEEKIRKLDCLAPPVNLQDLMDSIAYIENVERVLCVGHEPSLGMMATEIITGMEEENMLPLKKGGILCISMERPDLTSEAELLYLLHPMFLRHIGDVPYRSLMYAMSEAKSQGEIQENPLLGMIEIKEKPAEDIDESHPISGMEIEM